MTPISVDDAVQDAIQLEGENDRLRDENAKLKRERDDAAVMAAESDRRRMEAQAEAAVLREALIHAALALEDCAHGMKETFGEYKSGSNAAELIQKEADRANQALATGAGEKLLDVVDALAELTTQCEDDFVSDATSDCEDDESVAAGETMAVTFGAIRRARQALEALNNG